MKIKGVNNDFEKKKKEKKKKKVNYIATHSKETQTNNKRQVLLKPQDSVPSIPISFFHHRFIVCKNVGLGNSYAFHLEAPQYPKYTYQQHPGGSYSSWKNQKNQKNQSNSLFLCNQTSISLLQPHFLF